MPILTRKSTSCYENEKIDKKIMRNCEILLNSYVKTTLKKNVLLNYIVKSITVIYIYFFGRINYNMLIINISV